jgi:isopentenyldiphosphate isomerase
MGSGGAGPVREQSCADAIPESVSEELVDVVDADDRVVATVPRSVMRRERLLHRCVFVAVVHPDGRLLVHRRSESKDIWPGWWDLAVGGVVLAGESWDDAVYREVAEEIGVTDVAPEHLGGGLYEDDDVALIGRCYRIVHGGPFTFADGEVVRSEWVDLADLPRVLGERRFLPDSQALLLPSLLR